MTSWEDVFKRGREVADILQRRGRPTAHYDGYPSAVDGWLLCEFGGISFDTVYYGRSDFKDVWITHNILILGENGTIYEYRITNVERGTQESNGFRVVTTRSPSGPCPIRPQTLHPASYQEVRSDDVMKSLNRLTIKYNSDPEPAAPDIRGTDTFRKDEVKPTSPTPSPRRATHPPKVTWCEPEPVKQEGSDWVPIILACVAVAVVVTLIMVVILLTNDVQFR